MAANILWSAASRGIQAAMGFVAAIVVARSLSLDGLGEYLSALAVAGAILSVSYCGIQQFLVRETGRGAGEAGAILGAGVLIRLSLIVLAGLGLAGFAGLSPAGSRTGLAAVAVALGAEAFRSMGLLAGAVFQAHERMRPECLLAVMQSLLWGALLAVAIFLDLGAIGLLGALCLALAGHCLASWFVVVRDYERPRLSAGLGFVWPMLGVSLVIGLSVVLVQNLFRVNVLVLQWLGSPEDVAFFQTPHDLVLRFQVIFQAVMLAAFPALARLFAAPGGEGKAQGADLAMALCRLTAGAAGALALVFFLFAEPIAGTLYGAKMLPAAPCLRILALGTLPLALGMLWSQVLIARGGQRRALFVNAAALGVNLVLSLVLIPPYGVIGAAGAALAAYTASWLGSLSASRGEGSGGLSGCVNLGVLAAMGGGLMVAAALPGGWGGPAGLAAYVALVAVLRGAGVGDIRVLARCVRPVSRP
ncbi:oligosaccharide flippase family protein [Desulfovibrio sulfodismutans]|uniref:Oligosaccharide flippase family protein n=1 Tax=Desulfolutivibrio sulfodismutans TaxID=63561 RepID=A0A7K3NTS2_9BACT|nr:oligosaccharide flippase family protein [Desulfolutivibrio sulfodismutans]NDY58659.1 oligosaccharide flippase family protein [Desulfolutivibrio sulfodismutans]